MKTLLYRHRQFLATVGVFLLAVVVAAIARPAATDADPAGLRSLIGPSMETERIDPGSSAAEPAAARSEQRRPPQGAYTAIDVTNGATIRGTVRFDKAPGPMRSIEITKDQLACGHDAHPSERVVYDPDALTVANCLITLVIPAGKGWAGEHAEDERTWLLDQKQCKYVPHLKVLRPETQVNVNNSDDVVHNVHSYRNTLLITQFNFFSQPLARDKDNEGTFLEKPGKYIVKCDIHPWMNAYIWVVTNPYFAVTADDGTFSLENVPAGTYEIVCWHEGMQETPQYKDGAISGYDYGADYEERRPVTVTAGQVTNQDFTIPAPAGSDR